MTDQNTRLPNVYSTTFRKFIRHSALEAIEDSTVLISTNAVDDQTHDLQERAADCSMACARCRWLFAPARPAARVRSSVQNGRCVLLQPLSVARRTAETFCAGAPADDALLKLLGAQ